MDEPHNELIKLYEASMCNGKQKHHYVPILVEHKCYACCSVCGYPYGKAEK